MTLCGSYVDLKVFGNIIYVFDLGKTVSGGVCLKILRQFTRCILQIITNLCSSDNGDLVFGEGSFLRG